VFDGTDLNKQLQLDKSYENACCLGGEFEGEEEVVVMARLQCLIASSYLQILMRNHMYFVTSEMIQLTWLNFKRKCAI